MDKISYKLIHKLYREILLIKELLEWTMTKFLIDNFLYYHLIFLINSLIGLPDLIKAHNKWFVRRITSKYFSNLSTLLSKGKINSKLPDLSYSSS